MTLNFSQISDLNTTIEQLKTEKVPFKLGLILAKNAGKLKAEMDFYIEREREFANKFLEKDEETGSFIQTSENVFQIKKGMEQECAEARKELDAFTSDVDLRTIPVSLLESLGSLTTSQIEALSPIIEEEE